MCVYVLVCPMYNVVILLQDVCEGVECEDGECVPLTNGVCLTLYAGRKRLPCKQYICGTLDSAISMVWTKYFCQISTDCIFSNKLPC